MKKYLSEHKTGLIIAAVLIILAIFAICFYSPVRIQEPNMVAYSENGEKLEFELYIKWHRRLFVEDKASGSIVIDGVKYETQPEDEKYSVHSIFFYAETNTENVSGEETNIVKLSAKTPKLRNFTVTFSPDGGSIANLYGFPEAPQN